MGEDEKEQRMVKKSPIPHLPHFVQWKKFSLPPVLLNILKGIAFVKMMEADEKF